MIEIIGDEKAKSRLIKNLAKEHRNCKDPAMKFELLRYSSTNELVHILFAEIQEDEWPTEEIINWLNSSISSNGRYVWVEVEPKK